MVNLRQEMAHPTERLMNRLPEGPQCIPLAVGEAEVIEAVSEVLLAVVEVIDMLLLRSPHQLCYQPDNFLIHELGLSEK